MFRIWLYLNFKNFLQSIFHRRRLKFDKFIKKEISKQSNKKFVILFSQCRVALFFILKFLKKKNNKNEIIFCAYNLPEMINIAVNLKFKIKFCDLNYKSGNINLNELKKKISNKTTAVVLTNMFNTYLDSKKIRKLTKKHNIILIEDNAIYFDNYSKLHNKNYYSGSLGDFSIYSFNIMKNISSFYGGACSTNNEDFDIFFKNEEKKLKIFLNVHLIKQISIYLILKLMSINLIYKNFFFHIIKYSHKFNLQTILRLIYPSLKKINKKFPNYYFSKISDIAVNATYLQLKNRYKRKELFNLRKEKHKYYFKKLSSIKNKKFNLIKISDRNYQNFLDFPILVNDKKSLNEHLLNKSIEVRFKHYYNCEKMFNNSKKCVNAEKYERELLCLPAHPKIKFSYIDFIVKNIKNYYSK